MESHNMQIDGYVVGDDSVCLYEDLAGKSYKSFNLHSGKDWELIAITFINDDYKGGEIVFKKYNILIKPRLGSVLVFPKHMSDDYEIMDVTSGVRYTSILTIEKSNVQKTDCYMS